MNVQLFANILNNFCSYSYCHVIAHGDEEVRLILSSRVELAVSSSQKSDC